MRFGKRLLNSCLLLLCSCTVIPQTVHESQPSFDGLIQNSGLIRFMDDGSALITTHAGDRFIGLVSIYGDRFLPRLSVTDAEAMLTPSERSKWPGQGILSAEGLVKFAVMEQWYRQKR